MSNNLQNTLALPISMAILLWNTAFTQSSFNPHFSRFTTKEGLSDDHVLCALSDKRGFMWFGTEYGLARFDGQRFVVFLEESDNPFSLTSNTVSALEEDENGDIWTGTLGGGLCRFDPHNGKFEPFSTDTLHPSIQGADLSINDIFQEGEQLWLATYVHGIGRFDKRKKQFTDWYALANDSLTKQNSFLWNTVCKIAPSKSDPNSLWLAASLRGLAKLDKKTGHIRTFPIPDARGKPSLLVARDVMEDEAGIVWLATTGAGVCRFDPRTESFTVYPFDQQAWKNNHPTKNDLNDFCVKSPHEFWVASPEKGLGWFDKRSGRYHFLQGEYSGENLEADRNTQWLYADPKSRLWVFGEKSGVRLYDLSRQYFTYYHLPGDHCRSATKNALDFAFHPAGQRLFIATQACGCYEKTPGGAFVQRAKPLSSGDFQSYRSIASDALGNTWLGAQVSPSAPTTLFLLRPGGQYFEPFFHPAFGPGGSTGEPVNEILSDRKGRIWVATAFFKFFVIQPATGQVERVNIEGEYNPWWFVMEMDEDERGHLWIALRNGGVLDLDPETRQFIQYDEPFVAFNRVNSLEPTKDGKIWLSAGDFGIQSILRSPAQNPQKPRAVALAGEMTPKMEADAAGNLWLATPKGLGVMEPGTEKLSFFSTSDGLKEEYLLHYGLEIIPGLGVLVGQENGYSLLPEPLRLPWVDTLPAVLTDLYILGRSVFFEKNIGKGRELHLRHDENLLTIQFATLDFRNPSLDCFAFMLEGFEKKWQFTCDAPEATYANLKPGNYVFRLKSATPDRRFLSGETTLNMVVYPAWWQTEWFKGLVALALLGLVGASIYFFQQSRYRQRLVAADKAVEAKRLLLEKETTLRNERDRIAAEMHDDLGTGMSTIRFLSLAAKEKESDPAKAARIDKITRQAAQVMEKMADIIWVMNSRNDSLENFAAYVRRFAGDFLETHGITMRFEMPDSLPDSKLSGEQRRSLLLVIKECLHNVVKHAEATGVRLSVQANGSLEITVHDNGKGIGHELLDKLNDTYKPLPGNGLYNICQRMKALGGEALFENTEGTKVLLRTNIAA